jgi:FixJ family two-component response regulator
MSAPVFTVFLVDDDAGVLKALARRLSVRGYEVRSYSSPEHFLEEHDPALPGCAVLDLSMPGLNGLELQAALGAAGAQRPVIFLTGQGDVPTSVQAMKAGAVDFLTKPVRDEALLDAIARAEAKDRDGRQTEAEMAVIRARLATLTRREREVLDHVLAGRLNKQIAWELGTVEQTIKVHRRRVMDKLGVHSMRDLMQLSSKVGLLR